MILPTPQSSSEVQKEYLTQAMRSRLHSMEGSWIYQSGILPQSKASAWRLTSDLSALGSQGKHQESIVGELSRWLFLTVDLTRSRNKMGGASVKDYLDLAHCNGKTHPKSGWHHSKGWDPRMHKRRKPSKYQHPSLCVMWSPSLSLWPWWWTHPLKL